MQRVQGDGIFSRALVTPDRNNFAPRFGASYRLSDHAVVKGGYAIFYQAIDRLGSSAALPLNPPQLIDFRGYESRFNEVPKLLLRDPFPGGSDEFNPQTIDLRSRSFAATAPWSQQYSFGFQFRFDPAYLLDISYVGGDSNRIRKLRPLNQGILNTDGTITQPFPDWARLSDHMASDATQLQRAASEPAAGDLLRPGFQRELYLEQSAGGYAGQSLGRRFGQQTSGRRTLTIWPPTTACWSSTRGIVS